MKRNDMNISHIPTVVTAACILHNICEIHGETFNDSWLREVDDYSFPQPTSGSLHDGDSDGPKVIRNALVHYFNNNS